MEERLSYIMRVIMAVAALCVIVSVGFLVLSLSECKNSYPPPEPTPQDTCRYPDPFIGAPMYGYTQ